MDENTLTMTPATETPADDGGDVTHTSHDQAAQIEELLVEEISIDGMCGVY